MKKRTLIIVIMVLMLMLGACKVKTPPEQSTPSASQVATDRATKTPDGPTKAPTHTPMHLGPIYQTKVFLGGLGWANNVDKSVFYHTIDFGQHWKPVTPPELSGQTRTYPIISNFFYSGKTAYVLLSRPEEKSLLFRSGDGGASWESTPLDFPGGQLYFITSTEGYMLSDLGVGAGSQYVAIMHTTDGGKTWETIFSHEPGQAAEGLPSGGIKNGITFMNADVGFITGSQPVSEFLYLYKTDDGGRNWEQQTCENLPIHGEADMWEPGPVRRVSSTEAFVAIEAFIAERETTVTHFCKTSDTGESWQYISSLDQIEINDFGSSDFGVAIGNGKVYRTIDGAVTWEDFSHNVAAGLKPVSIQLASDKMAYMVLSSTAPGDLEALNQNRIFTSLTNGRLWRPIEAAIIN